MTTSYAQRLATSLRNAYEMRDRDMFDRELGRMVATLTYTGPVTNDERAQADVEAQWGGTPTCGRSGGCQCATWPQAKTCMHRRA